MQDRVVLRLAYQVSEPQFTADLRERFDRDADGILSGAERTGLEQYVGFLARQDLRVEWDGHLLEPNVSLEAASGLERALPSAYPIRFAWRLEYRFAGRPGPHVLRVEDREARWNSDFACRLLPGRGVEASAPARSFAFPHGRGSFRIEVSIGRDR